MNSIAKKAEGILSEVVGDFIAKATVKKNCELIGATTDNITAAQLPELADKIEKSVSFFSGEEKGKAVAERIRIITA